MKTFVVPASLFVKGQLTLPIQLTHEKDENERRIKRIEAETKRLPKLRAKVADLAARIAQFEQLFGVDSEKQ